MFLAHLIFTVEPARRPEALSALLSETAMVRAMPGCALFLPFTDPADAAALGVIHEWESEAQFAAYLASPGFAEIGAQLRPMMTAPPVSRRFDATLRSAA